MSEKTIKMGIESLSLAELLEKIAIKKKKASERQRKFREEQKVKNPNYYKDRAEYQKKLRNKEKEILEEKVKIEKVIIDPNGAKETIKPVIIPKDDKEVINDVDVQNVPIGTTELEIEHYNGIVLLKMSYFKIINYDITKKPYWQKGIYNTEEELKKAKALSQTVIKNHITKITVINEEYYKKAIDDKVKELYVKILEGNSITEEELKYLKENDNYFKEPDTFLKSIKLFAKEFIKNPRKKGCVDTKPSLNTFINYLKPITNILSRVEKDEDIRKNYTMISNIISNLDSIYIKFRKKNIMTIDKNGNKKVIDYGDVYKTKELMDTNEALTIEEKALAACYLLFPTRRIEDYQHLKLANDINETNDTNNNYLVVDAKNIKWFVFNKHKTAKDYNSQIYNIEENKSLEQYLKPHILNISDNAYIFLKGNKKIYNESEMSLKLKKIFTKIFKIELTLDNIRSSAENYNNTKGRTVEQREQFSLMMGHSLLTGMNYQKI
tara:strand:+ start:204 stop:1688 length:1485 start_codon:yes stop_codon:yes gene_type:complete